MSGNYKYKVTMVDVNGNKVPNPSPFKDLCDRAKQSPDIWCHYLTIEVSASVIKNRTSKHYSYWVNFRGSDRSLENSIDISTGKDLDALAELFGLKRNAIWNPSCSSIDNEQDVDLRKRILDEYDSNDNYYNNSNSSSNSNNVVTGKDVKFTLNGVEINPTYPGLDPGFEPATPLKCECGATSIGSPKHDTWCPLYEK